MYLRVTKRRNSDGSVVRYYQLAENVWSPERGCAVAQIVHNFGRADQLDGDKLKRLARSILRIFSDDASLLAETGELTIRDSWPFGGVWALEHLWNEIGIGPLIKSHAKSSRTAVPLERALFAMVANRALSPYSKLYCWEQWLREEVFLPESQDIELHHLYGAMDLLEANKAEIEKAVFFKMADLMKRACELVASARFGKYLRQTSTGKLRVDRAAIEEAARYEGKWVITSNDDTLTAEDLAQGYKQLMRVEQCWRQMKSGLGMRPVFHHRPWRIQAHVSICVLALLLERIAETRAGDTWRNIAANLGSIKVVEYDRAQARVRQTTQVRPDAADHASCAGTSWPSSTVSRSGSASHLGTRLSTAG